MEQYVKGFQRFHAGEDVRPVTSALASFYHLFQVYYKVRQLFLLQSATGITKCDDYYKVRQYMVHPSHAPRYSCRVKPMSDERRRGGGGEEEQWENQNSA